MATSLAFSRATCQTLVRCQHKPFRKGRRHCSCCSETAWGLAAHFVPGWPAPASVTELRSRSAEAGTLLNTRPND